MIAAGGGRGPAFDTHVHVWADDAERYPWRPILPEAAPPQHAVPPQRLVAEMDAAGVTHAVLVQPSSYGWDNSYLLDVLAAHADRFVGIVLVDPTSPDAARELERLARRRGVRGVRFHLLRSEHAAAFAPVATDVCAAAAASGLVITVQARPDHLPAVARMAETVPDATIVVDHLGLVAAPVDRRDPRVGALLALAALPHVSVKLSGLEVLSREAYPFRDCWELADLVVGAFGASRTMWASNFPHVTARCSFGEASAIPDLCLARRSQADRDRVRIGTAASIWGAR